MPLHPHDPHRNHHRRRLKASPPHDGYQATRFTLDDTDRTLQGMQILSVDQRRPPILQPSIRTLTVLKG